MATDYETIKRWAVNNVGNPKLRKAISRDISHAYADAHNTKGQALWQTIYRQLSGFDNLPNGLNSLKVGDRVKADQLHPCWLCGTLHGDGYVCPPVTGGVRGRDSFIGHNCAERLTGYGLRAGVLTEADKRTRMRKARETIAGLDELVLNDGDVFPLVFESTRPTAADAGMLGHQLGWVGKNYKAMSPEVKAAYDRLSDSYVTEQRGDVRIVLNAVEELKPFPASTYKNIAADVQRMEDEGGVALGTAAALRRKGKKGETLTCKQVIEYLGNVDYRTFRIRKNEERLGMYEDATLGRVMNFLTPLIEHDRPLWAGDLPKQRYTLNKVLSEGDYRTVSGCFNRWRFGYTSEVHGPDSLRLRNRAIRLESVDNFEKRLDTLVAVERKFKYAQEQVGSDDYRGLGQIMKRIEKLKPERQTKAFREAVYEAQRQRRDPLVKVQKPAVPIEAFRDYTSTAFEVNFGNVGFDDVLALVRKKIISVDRRIGRFQRNLLPQIEEHARYGFVLKSDVKNLEQAYGRRKNVKAV